MRLFFGLLVPPLKGVYCITSNMPGEERSCWGEVPPEHLGLSALVTFHTWPVIPTVLMPVPLLTISHNYHGV